LLARAGAEIEALAGVDPRLDAAGERVRAIAIEADDLARELRAYAEDAERERGGGSEQTLDGVEGRLAALQRLMRKHGGEIAGVLAHAASARARGEEIAGAEVALGQATEALTEAQARLDEHVAALRATRERAAPRLEAGVREQLGELAMPDATFAVSLSAREAGPAGADAAEFLIAPNPGVPAAPLREVASGGELSRVMLALIAAAAEAGSARPGTSRQRRADSRSPRGRTRGGGPSETLVFDEIDAGIGGHAARAVGTRLRGLGETRQLLCITHLPQIASLAARHFAIVKETSGERARTSVVQLGEREVVSELVRMLGADAGDAAARRHARDLLKAA
jgi:DNA repair protein RecN (Recombination protein N)